MPPSAAPSPPPASASTDALGHRPALMAILNVNADSFSDPRSGTDASERIEVGRALHAAGAALVDVGAESASPATPAVQADAEVAALRPVLAGLHAAGITTSVDTYKPTVAAAVVAAGTSIVNDYSGLVHPELAEICASGGARLVLTHNPAGVKNKLLDPSRYDDVVDDVAAWFDDRLVHVDRLGLPPSRVLLDPGVDLSKTPAQSIEVLRGLPRLAERFGLPLLVAVSRKDFIGAIAPSGPGQRDPGTLAALAPLCRIEDTIARVHDVRAAAQFLDVLLALEGPRPPDPTLNLPPRLRRQEP